jgi:hypothetical protein
MFKGLKDFLQEKKVQIGSPLCHLASKMDEKLNEVNF